MIRPVLNDLLHLIYPEGCVCCERELSVNDETICSFCSSEIAMTNFDQFQEPSPMDKLFWGRVEVNRTYAHLFFEKQSGVQNILFNLKYKHQKPLGKHFGRAIGKKIKPWLSDKPKSALVPVPLHHRKKFIRGYNQSKLLARGISEETEVPIIGDLIKRSRFTETQTKKSRFERWDNLQNAFVVNRKVPEFDHVIIVDDVITTGSTIENIVLAIKDVHPHLSFSVVTLAIA